MKNPMQPLVYVDAVIRFKANSIVTTLLNFARQGKRLDLNDIASMPFSQEDREQFAQLIGYSVSGFGDLSYVSPETVAEADRLADELHLELIVQEIDE